MIDEAQVKELLRLNEEGRLFHREGQELEFKEQFSLSSLADYFRDFAAFSNNRGGFLIFGVKDKPREIIGLSIKAAEQFEKIDPEKITGFLLECFSSEIRWSQATIALDDKKFGVFRIEPSPLKPIIAKKDVDKHLKNGEIYYRYGGRTQKIQSAELEAIINQRIEQNNTHWLSLVEKIGRAGPQNAAILDTEKGLIERDENRVLVIDEALTQKLKFVQEGHFVESEGAATLRLVGDVVPVNQVEVVRHVKENLTKTYPLSAQELANEVRKKINTALADVWKAIKDNDLKNNPNYSAYNFRSKSTKMHTRKQE